MLTGRKEFPTDRPTVYGNSRVRAGFSRVQFVSRRSTRTWSFTATPVRYSHSDKVLCLHGSLSPSPHRPLVVSAGLAGWYHEVFMDSAICGPSDRSSSAAAIQTGPDRRRKVDAYFSVDVETDGPIPGPYSLLSFAIVYAGSFDGSEFRRPEHYDRVFYRELRPISERFEVEALQVNGLDRERLCREGNDPGAVMSEAYEWVCGAHHNAEPVLVAYPLSFDWTWLYWYFVQFSSKGSPFYYSRCFDIKTAFAVKARIPISEAGRSRIIPLLRSQHANTHHAVDDAIAQAEIFANVFEWDGRI